MKIDELSTTGSGPVRRGESPSARFGINGIQGDYVVTDALGAFDTELMNQTRPERAK